MHATAPCADMLLWLFLRLLPSTQFPVMVTEQERISTDMSTHQQREEVCGQKAFTEVEGRPVVRERVERIMEHRPVEKQVRLMSDSHCCFGGGMPPNPCACMHH